MGCIEAADEPTCSPIHMLFLAVISASAWNAGAAFAHSGNDPGFAQPREQVEERVVGGLVVQEA